MCARKTLRQLTFMLGAKNMDILNISVGGFRNISSAKLNLSKITALVGLNGYGKSNIMDAIDFGIDYIHASASKKLVLMSSKKCIPLLNENAGMDYTFKIEARIESDKQSYLVRYEYSFSWGTEKSSSKILSEYLSIKKDEKNQKFNLFLKRVNTEAKYKSSETGRCSKIIKIDDDLLVLNKLLALDDLYYSDILQQIDNIQFFIERHLDPNSSYMPDPFIIKGFNELELDGIQSIPRAIFFLKEDYPNEYDLLMDAFKQLFPEIVDINVREIRLDNNPKVTTIRVNSEAETKVSDEIPFIFTDSIYSMNVTQKNIIQPLSFERLSDGTKRVFLMLTFAVIANIKGLSMIAIEEPENSLHPSLLQNYLNILNQLMRNCKIIITSHSPYIIQYLNPCGVYIGMTNFKGEADFRSIAPSKVKSLLRDASEYDKSVGDYIFNLLSSSEANDELMEYMEVNG